MKKYGKFLLPILLCGFIALQGLALPYSLSRFFFQNGNDDEEEEEEEYVGDLYDSTDFVTWSKDSLQKYIDTLLHFDTNRPLKIKDSLILGDSPDSIQHHVDSFYRLAFVRDSIEKEKIAFQKWFDSLSKKEQKRWILENVTLPAKIKRADSLLAIKDSIKAIKDSITENTPRILDTCILPQEYWYKRIVVMKFDKKFGNLEAGQPDTSYNYHFYDYPFFKQDINATWTGMAGSAVQPYTFHKRAETENCLFYTPLQSWSYTPDNLPAYNTKTPYTELAYWGTLLAGDKKEEINLRLMTTQNITPRLNVTFELNKFGGAGSMANQQTASYNMALSTNYLGKKYTAHAGWIHSKSTLTENGGFVDNMWIRDTTVDAKEVQVNLSSAENTINRNSLFINHSYRIPFGSDSLTTAFIGHSGEWSLYDKKYNDKISDAAGRAFYHGNFFIAPNQSSDTLQVMNLDNRLYLRLQPWKETSAISKIDVGIGDKYLTYKDFYKDSTFVGSRKTKQNNIYAYAGARGMIRQYFNWDADARFYFAGYQVGDFDVNANIGVNFYPFRRQRKSPLSVGAHFHTDLTRPDQYMQHLLVNHYKWDNDFGKTSTTRISATVDIPYWKLNAEVAYSLLGNRTYFDSLGTAAQYNGTVNVLSASLRKEFVLWKLHFDNKILFQMSSNHKVAPVPMLALNLRYYLQFDVVKNVMQMQLGANMLFSSKWNMPAYNPNVGVFYNQTSEWYGCCPYIDVFLNIQWKRACIFIKGENINQGWPTKPFDYFTADHYIHSQRGIKFGICWPFYIQPQHRHGSVGAGVTDNKGMSRGGGEHSGKKKAAL